MKNALLINKMDFSKANLEKALNNNVGKELLVLIPFWLNNRDLYDYINETFGNDAMHFINDQYFNETTDYCFPSNISNDYIKLKDMGNVRFARDYDSSLIQL